MSAYLKISVLAIFISYQKETLKHLALHLACAAKDEGFILSETSSLPFKPALF